LAADPRAVPSKSEHPLFIFTRSLEEIFRGLTPPRSPGPWQAQSSGIKLDAILPGEGTSPCDVADAADAGSVGHDLAELSVI
jgi:hypothetical protein